MYTSQETGPSAPQPTNPPFGEFGLFASALIAVSLGLAAFCASCFLAILGMLVWNRGAGHGIDFTIPYRYVGLPIGIATMLVSGAILLILRIRRLIRS